MLPKLSVSMIVKNEEAMLADCLESVKGADEIVICDTGSTDKTIKIAKKYTPKVFTDYEWEDHFAKARNHSLKKCTGDWILIIDADEILEEGGVERIRKLIDGAPYDIINLVVHCSNNRFNSHRLFRNKPDKIFWKGAIHNYLSVPGQFNSDIKIKYRYSPAHKEDPDRALRILEKEVAGNPDVVRERYYLGREYFYKNRFKEAVGQFKEYLNRSTWLMERADAYYLMARSLWQLRKGEDARKACLMAISINANFKEAIELMAEMSWPKNRDRWLEFAQEATNEEVLFVRMPVEQKVDYWDEIYKKNPSRKRYESIYKKIGEWVGTESVEDVGCGTGELAKYVVGEYVGFDISEEAIKVAKEKGLDVWTGDVYDRKSYVGRVHTVFCEVLEHLERDFEVFRHVRSGSIIFSVPSFKDESHVRTYTEEIVRIRYRHYIKINKIVRFNWDGKKWVIGGKDTKSHILLVKGERI